MFFNELGLIESEKNVYKSKAEQKVGRNKFELKSVGEFGKSG